MRKTLAGFCLVYLPHYFDVPIASFHKMLMDKMGDPKERNLLVLGFRGSGKSTLSDTALILWAALEKKYRFIIVCSDTGEQAKTNFRNIRSELENNEIILNDYGIMQSRKDEWKAESVVLSNGIRILSRSRGQKIRGLRHMQFRPDLIIVDDPEDVEWVHSKENRDKTERWLRQEVIPAMQESRSKLVLIGNLLHMDCLLARMRGTKQFKVIEIPILNEKGECAWVGKYPTEESLREQEIKVGAVGWQREYMLKAVAEEGAPILPEDIHYYDELPKNMIPGITGHGVDLAISLEESADYTSCVSGRSYMSQEENTKIYIFPNPYNKRVEFANFLKDMGEKMFLAGAHSFYVEDVGYQKAAIQEMRRKMMPVRPMKPQADKLSRLRVVAIYIKNGTVLFPRSGCEELLGQLLGFGVEKHDDEVDALVYLIQGMIDQGLDLPTIGVVTM